MRDWSPVLGLPLWVWLFIVLPSCNLAADLPFVAGPRIGAFAAPDSGGCLDGVYFASLALYRCVFHGYDPDV